MDRKTSRTKCSCKKHRKPKPPVDECNQPYIVNGQLNVTPPPCLLQSDAYTFLFNTLSNKILSRRFDLLLAAVHDQASYEVLLNAVNESQIENGKIVYRYILTDPNGIVVLDTNRPNNVAGDPHSNSYRNYQNGTIDENYNTRPEIMRSQTEEGGVGYNETVELDTILTPKKKVSIRLGRHLSSQGTIRINLLAQDTNNYKIVQTINDLTQLYNSIAIDAIGQYFVHTNYENSTISIYSRQTNGLYTVLKTIEQSSSLGSLNVGISYNGKTVSATTYTSNSGNVNFYSVDGTQLGSSLLTRPHPVIPSVPSQVVSLDITGTNTTIIDPNAKSFSNYTYSSNTWNLISTVPSSNNIYSVGMDDGDTLVVTTASDDPNTITVNVYALIGNVWTQTDTFQQTQANNADAVVANISLNAETIVLWINGTIYYSDKDESDNFGTPILLFSGQNNGLPSISADGNTIAITSTDIFTGVVTNYLYTRTTGGAFSQTILPPASVNSIFIGSIAVAAQNTDIVVFSNLDGFIYENN